MAYSHPQAFPAGSSAGAEWCRFAAWLGRGDGDEKTPEQALLSLAYLLNADYSFAKSIFGSLKKEIKMCDSCGCTPPEKPIEDEICSGCGKPKAECICEPEEK